MSDFLSNRRILGINGAGRIGKLTLWNHLNLRHFEGFVLNTGRKVGRSLDDFIDFLIKDSTYGSLDTFLYGYSGKKCDIRITDREEGTFEINGIPIRLLSQERNPKNIPWAKWGVRLVIECTGAYMDPTLPEDHPKGSVRGHLAGGVEKVIVSAPFKIADDAQKMPKDSGLFIYGVNHANYDPRVHHILSATSCTTTGLAHLIKPLLDTEETSEIVTASMSTIHAATNNQTILDSVPGAGAKDLRRNRSVFNNIIPTSTGAAVALEEILPEIKEFGFMADSVRIPTNTASLIVLNITFNTRIGENGQSVINKNFINEIYRKASQGPQKDMLVFSEKQNVSSDIIGYRAAIVIEGVENHTRTGFIPVLAKTLSEYGISCEQDIRVPVTHAKILGWYDNELGSYTNFLGKFAIYVDENLS